MFQNVTIYSTIVFFILSYNIYLLLINIFKILKTRILLNKVYEETQDPLEEELKKNQKVNKFNLLAKEITNNQIKA